MCLDPKFATLSETTFLLAPEQTKSTPILPMCQMCRRIGIINFPLSAYNGYFYLDGSVDVNHGTTCILLWSSTDSFNYFHSLLMVGRTTPIAAKYAQQLWDRALDEFEKRYKEVTKELSERNEGPKFETDALTSEEDFTIEKNMLSGLLEQNVLRDSVPVWEKSANERTPPRKIYGLPSPQKTKKGFSKSQKKKWARTRRELAQIMWV